MILRQQSPLNLTESLAEALSATGRIPLNEDAFKRVIAIERKRTERSKSPFVLMLLEVTNPQNEERSKKALEAITGALITSCRDTDLVGWYKEQAIIGAMFTGLAGNDKNSILSAILSRVSETLRNELTFGAVQSGSAFPSTSFPTTGKTISPAGPVTLPSILI